MDQPENQIEQPENQSETSTSYAAGPPQVQTQDVPAEPAQFNWFQRLYGVLLAPGETFADVNRKPDWIVPLLLVLLLVMGGYYFATWRIKPDMEKMARDQTIKAMERFGGQRPTEEQLTQAVERQKKFGKFNAPIGAIVVGIGTLIATVIFMLGLILLQAKTTFKKIFSVVLWSNAAIGIVSFIVLAASLMVKDEETLRSMDITKVGSSLPTNLAVVFDPIASPFLHSLLASVDIFTIWLITLTIIGFVAISGKKKAKGGIATMVIGIWIGYALLKASVAGLFG